VVEGACVLVDEFVNGKEVVEGDLVDEFVSEKEVLVIVGRLDEDVLVKFDAVGNALEEELVDVTQVVYRSLSISMVVESSQSSSYMIVVYMQVSSDAVSDAVRAFNALLQKV
jgi:hypothetical protein